MKNINIKSEILAEGLKISNNAIANYGLPYLEKRRAYGNSDPLHMRKMSLPQELYIGTERIICAVNVREQSSWTLDWIDGEFILKKNEVIVPRKIDFPLNPNFYNAKIGNRLAREIVTLYGGGALGIFAYGDCSLVQMNKPCQYCSIEQNRKQNIDFIDIVSPQDVYAAVRICLEEDDKQVISQIMLNGGNLPDADKSFDYYTRIGLAAREAVEASGRKLPVHLIAFPPNNLDLIDRLQGANIELAFNSEVNSPELFKQFCPGKEATGGQRALKAALDAAAQKLGKGNVYSIFVGGLEPLESLKVGLEDVAKLGATPVINVFHPDPGTPLANRQAPSSLRIMEMGGALQDVYERYAIHRPFYTGCGRNSIDAEAHLGLFSTEKRQDPLQSYHLSRFFSIIERNAYLCGLDTEVVQSHIWKHWQKGIEINSEIGELPLENSPLNSSPIEMARLEKALQGVQADIGNMGYTINSSRVFFENP